MNESRPDSPENKDLRAVVTDLCERLERVEERLGMETPEGKAEPAAVTQAIPQAGEQRTREEQESLEFEVGQTWFALIGIVVMAIGMAFLLSLPFASLPAVAPSLAGYIVCAVIFFLAKVSAKSFEDISKYLRGAGMLLLFFATWRLFDFGAVPTLEATSLLGRIVLVSAVGTNLVLAWRRSSQVLYIIAIVTGLAAALIMQTGYLFVISVTALALITAVVQVKRDWRAMTPVVFTLCMITYVLWAIGNPIAGKIEGINADFHVMLWALLVWIGTFSVAVMLRADLESEDPPVQLSALLLCGLGFGVFFLHHLLAYDDKFLVSHVIAAGFFLTISVAFWVREKSRFSTFIYAMTGYMALSFALISGFNSPEVFVALSLQSLVVIATAIYFCSPFIIVANSLIFIGIIITYMVVADVEQGMSIGFGVVALVSARILNWQKQRLSLQTELMRNIYLLTAFVIFPYALYYMLPETYVAVAWVVLALFYYGLFLFFGNRKYRWLGHSTLLLTALYVIVIGTSRLDSHYRIISFLILGSIMLIVSLVFTLIRAKRQKREDRGIEK